jgi:hypothetical protein
LDNIVARSIALFAAAAVVVNFAIEEQVTFSIQTEVGREAGGLAILGIWMGLSSVLTPSSSSSSKNNSGDGNQNNVTSAAVALFLAAFFLVACWAGPRFVIVDKANEL